MIVIADDDDDQCDGDCTSDNDKKLSPSLNYFNSSFCFHIDSSIF